MACCPRILCRYYYTWSWPRRCRKFLDCTNILDNNIFICVHFLNLSNKCKFSMLPRKSDENTRDNGQNRRAAFSRCYSLQYKSNETLETCQLNFLGKHCKLWNFISYAVCSVDLPGVVALQLLVILLILTNVLVLIKRVWS